MPLGFSDKIRFHVEQNICREDERGPQPDCFDKPSKIVYNFLNKVFFCNTNLFTRILRIAHLSSVSKLRAHMYVTFSVALSPSVLIVATVL
jgi:hypothetical protein